MKYRKNISHETKKNNLAFGSNIEDVLCDIHPNIEKQIEKLLKKHNINKYDYKITHFIIDIIQNETLKILKNAKYIKKEYNRKLKESIFRQKAEELNELLKSDWNEYKNENTDMLGENMGDVSMYNQGNQINPSYSNNLYGIMNLNQMQHMGTMENGSQGIGSNMIEMYNNFGVYNEHGRSLPFMGSGGTMNNGEVAFENNKYVYGNEKSQALFLMENTMENRRGNSGENNVGNYERIVIKNNGINNVGNTVKNDEGNNIEDIGENNVVNLEGNNVESVGKNNISTVGDSKTENGRDSHANNVRESVVGSAEGTNVGNGIMNDVGNTVEVVNIHPVFGNNKENILTRNNETENGLNQLICDDNKFISVQEQNAADPYLEGLTKYDTNKSPITDGIGITGETNFVKENSHNNQENKEVDEILIINEESVSLAIKEYILQNINRKKSVDFLYETTDFNESRKIGNHFLRRDIKYPTTLPPYLPDDCSVNTVLPPWDLCYIAKPFEGTKKSERKEGDIGTGSGKGKTAGAEGFQKWNR